LSAISPKAVLFLGKCGGLKRKIKVGEFILPIAAIRGEGTSLDYLPVEIPALPSFRLQMAVSSSIKKFEQDYWTGTVYTTNRRVWEHDSEFKKYLTKARASAIDHKQDSTWGAFVGIGFTDDPRGGKDSKGRCKSD
jgi:AMP nucleosidase